MAGAAHHERDTFNAWFYRQMAIWAGLLKRDELSLEYWERVRALRPRRRDGALHDRASARRARRASAGDRAGADRRSSSIRDVARRGSTSASCSRQLGEHEDALRAFERALDARREARPRLVRQRAVADQARADRRGDRAAEEEHRVAADEPVRLVPVRARLDHRSATSNASPGSSATCRSSSLRWRKQLEREIGSERGRDGSLLVHDRQVETTSGGERKTEARIAKTWRRGHAAERQKHHEYWRRNLTTHRGSDGDLVRRHVRGRLLRRRPWLDFNFFGWPFYFWVGAQGSLVVYVLLIWYYARYMNKLDREYGVEEEDEE